MGAILCVQGIPVYFSHSTRVALGALVLLAGCGGGGNGGSADPGGTGGPPPATLGGPISGLSADELAAFNRGKLVFERRFKPSQGLGPLYNATSCANCHGTPTSGGSSPLYRNFYLAAYGFPPAQFPLPGLPSRIVPLYGGDTPHTSATFTLEQGRIKIPGDVSGLTVVSAQRGAVPLFGTGLFEFVSDVTILAGSDPDDLDGDGISGRTNNDTVGIGRLGVKAQANNVELFTRGPLQNQMGITSNPFLGTGATASLGAPGAMQASANPNDPTIDNDNVPDPEISSQDLGDLIAFTRFLAPPVKKAFNAEAALGDGLFTQIGCVKCHFPSLPASRAGPLEAYTDLLLHDLGTNLADGMSFGSPQASMLDPISTDQEFRTQPLWGVSMHAPYLHDGRAETLDQAISLHEGEALQVRDAYLALSQADRDALIAFLEHL